MFPTVMLWDQAGQNTSQKEPFGRHFALLSKFHSFKCLCHSFLNWAKGVLSNACTMWLVYGGIASMCMLLAFIQSKKATLYTTLVRVNNKQVWLVQYSVGFEPSNKPNFIFMELLFCNISFGSCCNAHSYWSIPSQLGLDTLPFINHHWRHNIADSINEC